MRAMAAPTSAPSSERSMPNRQWATIWIVSRLSSSSTSITSPVSHTRPHRASIWSVAFVISPTKATISPWANAGCAVWRCRSHDAPSLVMRPSPSMGFSIMRSGVPSFE